MSTSVVNVGHKVVSNGEWLAARKALLAKEKELTRMYDALSRERLELPWERVEKNYVFDGPKGKETLADLFGDKSQLMIQHFMFGPEWAEGCPSCSLMADSMDGSLEHLAARDISLAVVSRATMPQIEAFQKRMGWRFKWVSSNANDFNWDYHVSFTKEEMERGRMFYNFAEKSFPSQEAPGVSAFYKDEGGEIFHTYSAFERGVEMVLNTYSYMDMAPKGRNEEGLSFPMAWVRHHDKYDGAQVKDAACCAGE
ncbi:MAG TPA: thioredoxin family protein [Edaphobacter sp.]|jgi:predicted dithiol-disulfide oxidoreductase (DUF899 family)|nr:thioredoxin family protein [Edaphobacter sp.]